MVHIAAPMAACLCFFGLTMFWSAPELISAASGESWWAPWSWSLNEMQALVNQGISVAHANYTWTGLLLALTGAAGITAAAIGSIKASPNMARPDTKSLDGIWFEPDAATTKKAPVKGKAKKVGRGSDPAMDAPKKGKYPGAFTQKA